MPIRFLLLVLVCLSAGAEPPTEADTGYSVSCVRRCSRRSYTGRCLSYMADYCDSGPGVACVARCLQRSAQSRCNNYDIDFCGNYPQCVPHCVRSSYGGKCLDYGADECRG